MFAMHARVHHAQHSSPDVKQLIRSSGSSRESCVLRELCVTTLLWRLGSVREGTIRGRSDLERSIASVPSYCVPNVPHVSRPLASSAVGYIRHESQAIDRHQQCCQQ